MPAVNLSFIEKEMTAQKLIYWAIKDGKAILAENNDALSPADSFTLLRERLAAIGAGAVTVYAYPVAKQGRQGSTAGHQGRRWLINLDAERFTTSPGPGLGPHTASPATVEKLHHEILSLEREKLSLKYEVERLQDINDALKAKISDLEKQLKDLEEEGDDDAEGIGGISPKVIENAIAQGLVSLFSGHAGGAPVSPTAAPVHGVNTFEAWEAKDADAPRLAQAILLVMEQDPATYKMIKNILLTKLA